MNPDVGNPGVVSPAGGAPESVIGRVVAILGAFDDDAPSLGLSVLARRVGMPKPTVHRLAAQLVESGLLERDGDRYQPGRRLFELGQRVPRSRVLRDAALPFMEDLYVACRETVHLAAPAGRDVFYLEKLVGHRSGNTPSKVAGRMPMHSTATGKAMLAHLPTAFVDEYLDGPLVRITAHTIVVPRVLREELAATRDVGWSIEREETLVGYVSVAAPVFGAGASPVAALSITAPGRRFDPDRFGPAVRTAALGLSRVLTARHQVTAEAGDHPGVGGSDRR